MSGQPAPSELPEVLAQLVVPVPQAQQGQQERREQRVVPGLQAQ